MTANQNLEEYAYIKDFKIKLKKAVEKRDARSLTYTVILNKDVRYRFVLEESEEYDSQLVFELFGDRGAVASSFSKETQKHYSTLEYVCRKSGMYFINLGFEDAVAGCGVLVYGFEK